MNPLDGITVVALEQAVAAPFATRQLADLGARVIKIERPRTGDFAREYDNTVHGQSSHFIWLNRNKESLTLDVKTGEGADVLSRLLTRADVFVQNLAPGAAERLGLGHDRLRELYPKLIACSISGYGDEGPYRDKKAYDLLIQNEAGVVAVTGDGDTMAKVGISVADIAGGMYAYSGILAALYRRAQTGHGEALSVSLFDALCEWMGYPLYYTVYGGTAPARTGTMHATIAPYGPFTSQDHKQVVIGIQNDREWHEFCARVLERPELAADARFATNGGRVAHRDELHEVINAVCASLTAASLVARLDDARIANARLNRVADVWQHPQLRDRGRFRNLDTPDGEVEALLPPVVMEDLDERMDAVPATGAHTQSILIELGYDAATVGRWRDNGIV